MKHFNFNIQNNNYNVKILSHEGNIIEMEVNGTSYSVKMKEETKKAKTPTLVRAASKRPAEPLKVNPGSSKTKIVAPIPGVVLSLDVKVGDTIKVGDRLLVLEAMKMENNIASEKAGTVTAVNVNVGQQVLQNEVMIELE
ncbi:biotin/lipoyl-containing protein [Maribacter luteus]|uniref:Acetyl-CoA carboxylase biotin carboxyl carrier protein subunit n=1 Tax=Maribacter luteus TaxID=2594478 RepID=A0A6I2MMY2_9FLAO|nr:biotin/lipoyl-containing protein [Maribacter luteus]MRX63840.1 acetyl-CoA carboxylase biotin carboxyl carrier protein subunit [Maribacter luteus]|tara:strand:- start:413 stop:832 length:420 start_codon:yes stop_codon:yes gene_type:complete